MARLELNISLELEVSDKLLGEIHSMTEAELRKFATRNCFRNNTRHVEACKVFDIARLQDD